PRYPAAQPNSTNKGSGPAGRAASSVFSGQMLYKSPSSAGSAQRSGPGAAHSPSATPVPNSSTGKNRNWNRPKNSIRYTGATPNSHTQAQESAHTSRYAASHMRAARENGDLLQRFINGLPLCAV